MKRDQLETAIREGIPFETKMADGEKCLVKRPYQIAVGPSNVLFVGDDDIAHLLPMLTMTGLSFLKEPKQPG